MNDRVSLHLRIGESVDGKRLFVDGKPEIPTTIIDQLARKGLKPQLVEIQDAGHVERALINKHNVPPPKAAACSYFVFVVSGAVRSVIGAEGEIDFDPTLRLIDDDAISLFKSDTE